MPTARFPRYGKIFRESSTLWNTFFHSMEKRSIRLRPHDPLLLFMIAKPRARFYEEKRAEQSGAGYDAQGAPSPDP
jgi:hypothetical protein